MALLLTSLRERGDFVAEGRTKEGILELAMVMLADLTAVMKPTEEAHESDL